MAEIGDVNVSDYTQDQIYDCVAYVELCYGYLHEYMKNEGGRIFGVEYFPPIARNYIPKTSGLWRPEFSAERASDKPFGVPGWRWEFRRVE